MLHGKLHFLCRKSMILQQRDGVAMGVPLEPNLANGFLWFYEIICPDDFKSVCCRRYLDDIFVLFESQDHITQFQD